MYVRSITFKLFKYNYGKLNDTKCYFKNVFSKYCNRKFVNLKRVSWIEIGDDEYDKCLQFLLNHKDLEVIEIKHCRKIWNSLNSRSNQSINTNKLILKKLKKIQLYDIDSGPFFNSCNDNITNLELLKRNMEVKYKKGLNNLKKLLIQYELIFNSVYDNLFISRLKELWIIYSDSLFINSNWINMNNLSLLSIIYCNHFKDDFMINNYFRNLKKLYIMDCLEVKGDRQWNKMNNLEYLYLIRTTNMKDLFFQLNMFKSLNRLVVISNNNIKGKNWQRMDNLEYIILKKIPNLNDDLFLNPISENLRFINVNIIPLDEGCNDEKKKMMIKDDIFFKQWNVKIFKELHHLELGIPGRNGDFIPFQKIRDLNTLKELTISNADYFESFTIDNFRSLRKLTISNMIKENHNNLDILFQKDDVFPNLDYLSIFNSYYTGIGWKRIPHLSTLILKTIGKEFDNGFFKEFDLSNLLILEISTWLDDNTIISSNWQQMKSLVEIIVHFRLKIFEEYCKAGKNDISMLKDFFLLFPNLRIITFKESNENRDGEFRNTKEDLMKIKQWCPRIITYPSQHGVFTKEEYEIENYSSSDYRFQLKL